MDPGHFLDHKDEEEGLSLDRSSTMASDHVVDMQDLTKFLDEASSPSEYAVFLLHWLFPELFDHCKLGEYYSCYGDGSKQELEPQSLQIICEYYSCYGDGSKQELEPQRLQIICNYTEVYFSHMQEEEAWLQQCAQHINDKLQGLGLDVGSEDEPPT